MQNIIRLRPLTLLGRWLRKLDDQLFLLDLDARNVSVDEAPGVNRRRWFEMLPHRCCDQRLDFSCRHSAD